MRKIILTLVLVLAFAVPAWAGKGPVLNVNGKTYSNTYVDEQGVMYVPIKTIVEELGVEVTYDEKTAAVTMYPFLERPPIVGEEEFVKSINDALDLLESFDPSNYMIICRNVKSISLVPDMVSMVSNSKDAFVTMYCTPERHIGVTQKFYNTKQLYNPIMIASTLVHEAVHAAQFNYGYINVNNINLREVEAYNHQFASQVLLGAPKWMIENTLKMQQTYLN